jgi:hypothetical protein
MPSLLDLSAELLLLIIEHLDTPATSYRFPAVYFAPRTSRDVASFSSCCRALRRLTAPTLYRNIRLRNDDKSGKSLQAVGRSSWAANLVRELNFEADITLRYEREEHLPLHAKVLSHSVRDVLSHLERFPGLEILSVQFRCGETQELDEQAAGDMLPIWYQGPDSFRDFSALKQLEKKSDWRAPMANTYDAVSRSKRPSTLTTLELRNLLPSGVSSFTTEAWQAFLRSLEVFRLAMHGSDEPFILAYGGFIENLDQLFAQLENVTVFRFAASDSGVPGPSIYTHPELPLNAEHMPMLQVLELQFCVISEGNARFIAARARTLKRIALEDWYTAPYDYRTKEHTSWATFLDIIADSLEAAEDPPLREFSVSPRVLTIGRQLGGCGNASAPISEDDREIELANSRSWLPLYDRWVDCTGIEDRYGLDWEDEQVTLAALFTERDQAAFDRVMAVVRRQ